MTRIADMTAEIEALTKAAPLPVQLADPAPQVLTALSTSIAGKFTAVSAHVVMPSAYDQHIKFSEPAPQQAVVPAVVSATTLMTEDKPANPDNGTDEQKVPVANRLRAEQAPVATAPAKASTFQRAPIIQSAAVPASTATGQTASGTVVGTDQADTLSPQDAVIKNIFYAAARQHATSTNGIRRAKDATLLTLHDQRIHLEFSELNAALVRLNLMTADGKLLFAPSTGEPLAGARHGAAKPVISGHAQKAAYAPSPRPTQPPAKPVVSEKGFTAAMLAYPSTGPIRPVGFASIDLDARQRKSTLTMEEARYLAELVLFVERTRGREPANRLLLTGSGPTAARFYALFGRDDLFHEKLAAIGAIVPGRGYMLANAFLERLNANHDLAEWAGSMHKSIPDLRRQPDAKTPVPSAVKSSPVEEKEIVTLFISEVRDLADKDQTSSLAKLGLYVTRSLIETRRVPSRDVLRNALTNANVINSSGQLITLTLGGG